MNKLVAVRVDGELKLGVEDVGRLEYLVSSRTNKLDFINFGIASTVSFRKYRHNPVLPYRTPSGPPCRVH